jgi:hypothetical protein
VEYYPHGPCTVRLYRTFRCRLDKRRQIPVSDEKTREEARRDETRQDETRRRDKTRREDATRKDNKDKTRPDQTRQHNTTQHNTIQETRRTQGISNTIKRKRNDMNSFSGHFDYNNIILKFTWVGQE